MIKLYSKQEHDDVKNKYTNAIARCLHFLKQTNN